MIRRVLLAAVLALSGCSFMLVAGPPADHARRAEVDCTDKRLAPVLDLILASYLLGAGIGFAAESPEEREARHENGLLVTHAGLGGVAVASAIIGFVRTQRCREAKDLLLVRREAAPEGTLPTHVPEPPARPRMFGIEASAGGFHGVGGGVRVQTGRAGVHLGAGWQPIFLGKSTFPIFTFFMSTGPGEPGPDPPKDYISSAQVNFDVSYLLHRASRYSEVGLTVGYRYSTIMRHGGAIGIYGEVGRGEPWSFFAVAGASFFPEGEARLIVDAGYPDNVNLVPDLFAGLSFGVGFHP